MHSGETGLTPGELHERLRGKQGIVVLLGDRLDPPAIDAGADLKVIANVAVGYDNLDVRYARSKGIVCTNTPDVLTDAVADYTWALILAITRRLGEGERIVRSGAWKGWAFDFMLGTSLQGKQLGIIGAGRIGRAVADRAAAFGMRVAVSSRRRVDWPGAEPMSFDRLLAPRAADRGGGTRRVRARAGGARRSAAAGECGARTAPWQRHARDTVGDGRSGGTERHRGAHGPGGAHTDQLTVPGNRAYSHFRNGPTLDILKHSSAAPRV